MTPPLDPLLAGLHALAASAFPKRCATCGRTFATVEDYLEETQRIAPAKSGLKQVRNDDGGLVVELFRNCPCGSTLMDVFVDRRDPSEKGQQRRQRFGELLDYLETAGLARDVARQELIKVMAGHGSTILQRYRTPGPTATS